MFREHGWGTWERLRASHLETWEFMLGKSIAPILSLALQLVVMLGLGAIIFDLHVSGSIPAFVAVAAMLAVMEVALGFMLLAIFRSTLQLNAATPTTVEFNGRHEGTEHFGLDTARCPFLDHHLEEEFTLTDGTPWHFASVYCGTIDAAGVWSGTGNFTLTSPAGDTLSGHSTSPAQLPTTGVPYCLDIDGGTRQFTGASGMCSVDEHLSSDGFGIQAHSGTFACTLTIPANPAR